MSLADELQKLQALHARGALTDQEYAQAKDALLNARPDGATGGPMVPTTDWLHRLTRSRRDAILGGVCGGLGEHTPVPAWCWRLLFVVLFFAFGFGLLPYVVLWIFVPAEPGS